MALHGNVGESKEKGEVTLDSETVCVWIRTKIASCVLLRFANLLVAHVDKAGVSVGDVGSYLQPGEEVALLCDCKKHF